MASIRNLQLQAPFTNHESSSTRASTRRINSMTKHATAHGTAVLGTHESSADSYWIKWATDLKYQVTEVASNHDGSIIAASTTDGSVSILRGNDGEIIMTKSISSNNEDEEEFSHSIAFVQNNAQYNSNDILVIYQLTRGKDGPAAMDMILVSNIDGQGINSDSSGMEVNGVKLQLSGTSTVSLVNSCFISENVIRSVVSDQNGVLSIHDYNVSSKKASSVMNTLELKAPDGNEDCHLPWEFESQAGIHLDLYNPNTSIQFIVVAGKQEGRTKICWFDLNTLEYLCEHQFNDMDGCEVLSVSPLMPCFENTVSVAVALRPVLSVGGSSVILLQGVLGAKSRVDDDIMNDGDHCNARIDNTHELYTIQVGGPQLQSIDFVDCLSTDDAEFGLRYKVASDSSIEYKEFHSGTKNTIARIRLLLARNEVDKADELLSESTKDELSTPFGSVHSSEVVLMRFKSMLSNKKILTGESKDRVKECLHRLSFGAVSGGSSGVKSLVEASQALHCWSSEAGPYIRDYRMALSAMAMSIANALQGVSSKHVDVLKNERRILESKAGVFKTIETVLVSSKPKVKLSSPLLRVNNHIELYHLLISLGAFKVAESVRQSETGTKTITREVVASSVTKISPQIDPNAYCAWLQNVVFPGLTINHQILETMFAWGCEIADSFDQDGSYGIDASISLLETIQNAVAKLTVNSHGSFASYSPFSGIPASANEIPDQINLNESIDSQNSSSSSRSRDHSLLNSALKAVRANKMDLDQSTLVEKKSCSFKTKLMHAQIIKAAREHGLSARSLKLSAFWKDGGADFGAKELVRLFFKNAWGDYLADHSHEKEKVERFCSFANVSFDHAVEQYSKDLCSEGNIDASTLSRANDLVAACSSPDVKCKITLRFVRTAQVSSSKPSCLKALAKEAIQWATNEELRSELQEASRLLGIDEILRRYCGNNAPEVFRVSDPVHSARLVEFVTRKINSPSVLSDVLYLCSAFTHLSPLDHCSALIERIITATVVHSPVADQCTVILRRLYSIDVRLAESVAVRVSTFCTDSMRNLDETIVTSSDESYSRHENICAAAVSLCRAAVEMSPQGSILKFHKSLRPATSKNPWAELMREFQRIHELNTEFRISISLRTLRSWCTHDFLMNKMVEKAMNRSEHNEESTENILKLRLTKARRGCSLLFGSDDCNVITSRWCKAVGYISCHLVKTGDMDSSMMLLAASGLLDEIHNPSAYEAIVSVSEALCSNASDTTSLDDRSMKSVILANSLLNEHALVFCPASLLPFMTFLSNLVDVAGHMILKSDCGVGEKMEAYKHGLLEKSRCRRKPLSRPITHSSVENGDINKCAISLHPSWHTSDGLLLPPMEALAECMTYCKGLLSVSSGNSMPNLLSVHDFLESRGAYSISLRMLACASVVTASKTLVTIDDTICQQQTGIIQKIFFHLAERSLGGSGTGNTNARIDYHLAVPSLLNLHVKVAFKAYKRCLPSAMSRRDFDRVIALANVGSRVAGSTSMYDDGEFAEAKGWKDQKKFALQCHNLTSKAFWWNVLKRLSVAFDFTAFDSAEKEKDPKAYISSLVFDLIRCGSKVIVDPSTVQLLASDFCKCFELDQNLPVQKHIEFLLSSPGSDQNDDVSSSSLDIRDDLISCAAVVHNLLNNLPNEVARSSILRKSLMALEKVEESGEDFERYAMILSIYNSELRGMLSSQSKMNSIRSLCLHQEIERIDRRQDALGILSSFYSERKAKRPCFQKCFQPLPAILDIEKDVQKVKIVGVLGSRGSYSEESFDPIKPLQNILQSEPSPSTTSALGPICIALGVPSGYIHARVLVERMIACKSMGGSLPPFETEVAPIIKKLKISNDGAELAEWCASQYEVHSEERLSCLNSGLNIAIKASTEAEQRLLANGKKDNQDLVEKERNALERVQRLTKAKSALSDIITVKAIIKNEMVGVEDFAIKNLTFTIVGNARLNKEGGDEITPEQFAENLYVEGSLVAATASLDVGTSLDMAGLCRIASVIHKACTALEDHYSHINLGRISRALVRRWLLHGDEGKGPSVEQQTLGPGRKGVDESMDCSMDEDDTMDFVLDLNMTTSNTTWTDDVGSNEPKLKRLKTMTADEEQSSLTPTTTREVSEYLSSRVGLRVAFVMSFAAEFHPDGCEEHLNEENIDPNAMDSKKIRPFDHDLVRKHARYLLKLVFSRTNFEKFKGDVSLIETSQTVRSGLGTESVNTRRVPKHEGKALTFAMRHRALRAAAALCPEDIMNAVVAEEGFFRSEKCSLSKCCFGSFVAKEIEAMGLPLPHSDLIQLSTMHQPSYARTLWRHRSTSTSDGFKGRLMLLILELALREGNIVDAQLVTSILTEIIRLNLPRTNLLVCECISHLKNVEDLFTPANQNIGSLVLTIIKKLAASVLHDISVQDGTGNQNNCIQTLEKFGKVIISFMSNGISKQELDLLINSMTNVATHCNVSAIRNTMFKVAATMIREVKGDSQGAMLQKLCSSAVDASFPSRIATIVGSSKFASVAGSTASTKDCLGHLLKIEDTFNQDISNVLFQEGNEI